MSKHLTFANLKGLIRWCPKIGICDRHFFIKLQLFLSEYFHLISVANRIIIIKFKMTYFAGNYEAENYTDLQPYPKD